MPKAGPPLSGQQPAALRLADQFMHLFFPERCLLCRAVLPKACSRPLCASCDDYSLPVGPVCPACGLIGNDDPDGCSCRLSAFPLQGLFSLCRYEERWRKLLHTLKYRRRRSLARPLGCWLGDEIALNGYCQPDLVVPVPLHRAREKVRGFNQSALLAAYAAKRLGVPSREIVKRIRETDSQTTLSRRARRENVKGAFACRDAPAAGSIILLVDDIYSTGSTMRETAKILGRGGALVYGAVVAYNPSKARP